MTASSISAGAWKPRAGARPKAGSPTPSAGCGGWGRSRRWSTWVFFTPTGEWPFDDAARRAALLTVRPPAAGTAGVRIEPILIGGPSEFRTAFAAMAKAEAQAVIVQALFDPHRVILIELAGKYRLASLSGSRETTAAGGLVSMAANHPNLYERAAFYVDKILKGSKPADLPVEQPEKFDLTLNMKTAKALGLTISPTL